MGKYEKYHGISKIVAAPPQNAEYLHQGLFFTLCELIYGESALVAADSHNSKKQRG